MSFETGEDLMLNTEMLRRRIDPGSEGGCADSAWEGNKCRYTQLKSATLIRLCTRQGLADYTAVISNPGCLSFFI